MPPQRPRRRRLPSVLGGVLVLALVALCCAQVLPFVRARLTWLLLPTSNVAPPPAHMSRRTRHKLHCKRVSSPRFRQLSPLVPLAL
jgi:hypothetical protein